MGEVRRALPHAPYPAHMAWAEKLPSGRWRGVYRDGAGRRRSAGTFTHKVKATNAAGALEQQARRDAWRDADSFLRPWGEWCERWWASRVVEDSTRRGDTHRKKNHLEPRWANVPIGSITRHDVREWVAALHRELGPESVKRVVHLFSASMNAAVDAEVIPANPAARLKLVGGAPAQERYLTRDEYAAIRAQLPTPRDQLVADVLVNTGLRWGEAAGLHLARIDTARGVVRVVETYDETEKRMKAYPKGKRVRDVPLVPELAASFGESTTGAKTCGAEHPAGHCVGPLALTTEEGAPLRNSNWAYRVWHPAVKAAGVGRCRVHDLRHTYASWLLQEGIPLAEVGRLLGHVSPQTTQRYAHLAETPSAAILAALRAPRKPHDEAAAQAGR